MHTPDEILDLVDEGRFDEARDEYEKALREGGGNLDMVADAAHFYVNTAQPPEDDRELLERGLDLARRARALAEAEGDGEVATEMLLLEAAALSQLGAPADALSRLDVVLAREPDHPGALLERGNALYELCRFDEARVTLTRALDLTTNSAWGHHTLGLVLERLGDADEAERRFALAQEISPDDFPQPVHLSPAEFDAVVEDALEQLPDSIRQWLSNVAITVDDLPTDDDLLGAEPPLSPSILGLFRGSPVGDKASMDPWSHFPSSIALYQRNLERFARNRDDLVEQIEITLVHEVGHFLGLDEDELWERGLD
jgi:predicted Zn-dependent protease with MMP-like domain